MKEFKSKALTPKYCCDCDSHKRTNTWRTDYCRAKQMLCVEARGGVVPTLICDDYEEKTIADIS